MIFFNLSPPIAIIPCNQGLRIFSENPSKDEPYCPIHFLKKFGNPKSHCGEKDKKEKETLFDHLVPCNP